MVRSSLIAASATFVSELFFRDENCSFSRDVMRQSSGQLARDIDGNCVGKGDTRAQIEQTFQNPDRCLKAAGATRADVVKANTFVTDFDEFQ